MSTLRDVSQSHERQGKGEGITRSQLGAGSLLVRQLQQRRKQGRGQPRSAYRSVDVVEDVEVEVRVVVGRRVEDVLGFGLDELLEKSGFPRPFYTCCPEAGGTDTN